MNKNLFIEVIVSDKGKRILKDRIKISDLTEETLRQEVGIPGCEKYQRGELIRQMKTEWRHLGLLYEAQIVRES